MSIFTAFFRERLSRLFGEDSELRRYIRPRWRKIRYSRIVRALPAPAKGQLLQKARSSLKKRLSKLFSPFQKISKLVIAVKLLDHLLNCGLLTDWHCPLCKESFSIGERQGLRHHFWHWFKGLGPDLADRLRKGLAKATVKRKGFWWYVGRFLEMTGSSVSDRGKSIQNRTGSKRRKRRTVIESSSNSEAETEVDRTRLWTR
ncbi:hypothetical protein SUNI508_03120 [Seiridium unicorne]|uniref:C2H2-type domain-containing protein n=1 Tax=Seiridium unicorne TaxID=138068 RepID=A0ABR2VH05_9PEZI